LFIILIALCLLALIGPVILAILPYFGKKDKEL
jgi:hypothetical protein